MSLSSLVSAAQTAVDMSQAAAAAAEEAMVAAKLAKVHAQAALAAAELAIQLDQKVKKEKETLKPPKEDEADKESISLECIERDLERKVIVGDEEKEDSKNKGCANCRLKKERCLNGKFLLKVTDRTPGIKLKTWGSSWSKSMLGKTCVVEGGGDKKVFIKWITSAGQKKGDIESYSLKNDTGGSTFKFCCDDYEENMIKAPVSYFVHRLPFKKTEKEYWEHAETGEKHRIKFSTSENIVLTGLGFLVAKSIDRVTITVCHQLKGRTDHSPITTGEDFWNVKSSKSSVILKLKKPLPLTCDRIYLLTVNLHGGASIVGHGGEEFISVARSGDKEDVLFKFESYKEERTDVEKGVIEKIYFEL